MRPPRLRDNPVPSLLPPRAFAERVAAAPDPALAVALERGMTVDRSYRQRGCRSVSSPCGPACRNTGCASWSTRSWVTGTSPPFLNFYGIADAKTALAHPAQAEVPIPTIALDAGFNSLGPFNRAFKAEAGMTPASSADSPRLPPCQSDDFQNQVVVKI